VIQTLGGILALRPKPTNNKLEAVEFALKRLLGLLPSRLLETVVFRRAERRQRKMVGGSVRVLPVRLLGCWPTDRLEQRMRGLSALTMQSLLMPQARNACDERAVKADGKRSSELSMSSFLRRRLLSQVHVQFLAQATLGTDAVAKADDQHAHHQLRINGVPTDLAVVLGQGAGAGRRRHLAA
jgi:hypothetical protein